MPRLITFAKNLRKNSTEAEKLLWHYLRAKQLGDLKFRRQQAIGKYIVDFVCFNKKIIIELDGGQHAEERNRTRDQIRDQWLKSQGFIVLRFWDNDVLKNIEGVWEEIAKYCCPSP
jgi:very-short-patch-repair endonuclease